MEYNFRAIEQKWQLYWKETDAYKVPNESPKPKYYVLDMFPYPSGAGLHVGHPLGYIASDIYSRYKRLKGYNVLHPMGYDAFGLPAEQYAIEHGVHPAVSTAQNISNFRSQLDKIGFSYDWDREVRTSEPGYYKWTQWIFLQLFKSFFNRSTQKAEPIDNLVTAFEKEGNVSHPFPNDKYEIPAHLPAGQAVFTREDWASFDEYTQQSILMEYRLAFCGYGEVNWCEALGTVLANDEVVNGVSERGGHPVVKKKLRQWYLRITEYADRLLEGLNRIEFSESMKEMQSNWIGKSYGAEILIPFPSPSQEKGASVQLPAEKDTGKQSVGITVEAIKAALKEQSSTGVPLAHKGEGSGLPAEASAQAGVRVYTTRPDTIFGVDFLVIAPEHELVATITTEAQKLEVEAYIAYVNSRSERERQAEKKITGAFTGAYAVNPFDGREIPIWISEYVLAGYGTGAIMAVPCGDDRDFKFAKHFNIPITNIIGNAFNGTEANATKDAILENSGFLNGLVMRDAAGIVIDELEKRGIGKRKVNYKMRDAAFSRQRYWGEPFPIIWQKGIAYPLDESELPLELPVVESYSPGPEGEGPLANIETWKALLLETNTMPGYAGSSWYFLRYMDPHNTETFCDRKASDYWNQVDLYIGGTEHAVGHLLYSRLWTKALYDLGYIGFDEPFKKLLNQGMIMAISHFVEVWEYSDEEVDAPIFGENVITYDKEVDGLKPEPNKAIIVCSENDSPPVPYQRNGILYYTKSFIKRHRLKNVADYISSDGLVKNRLTKDDLNKYLGEYGEEFVGFNLDDVHYNSILKQNLNGSDILIVTPENEKMSKSKFNTVNPDVLVEKYGADTFRMYEMFLGPVEQSKPWDTKGIEGVHRFLKKLWRLFFDEIKGNIVNNDAPNAAELKVLHKTIKKIEEDTGRYSFNTAVSSFMIAVNELSDLKSHKRAVLEPLIIMLTPYAPHIAEELYCALGNTESVLNASFPVFDATHTAESTKEYPISINGKLRTTMNLSLDAEQPQVQELVLANEVVQKWLEGKPLKKLIFVKGKMVNVVV
jgi:leucyl-tRNA synthetase